MTRRITISVPDDVGAQLDAVPERQVSAYVTAALRARRNSDELRLALTVAGHRDFPYDPAGAASRIAETRISAAEREAAASDLAARLGLSGDDLRAALDAAANR
ncbi:hypothetical protein R8Z50_10755 [Longispora sp. K20-0274]|uniref:hypothetical protein n=1 Tax=Longispora sp. K20-0274 TaxID=3088255 RepID=UPI00399C4387